MANVHYMKEPGGGEADKEEGQAEAEEGHDDGMTPTQLYTAFCLSSGVGDKQQLDWRSIMSSPKDWYLRVIR